MDSYVRIKIFTIPQRGDGSKSLPECDIFQSEDEAEFTISLLFLPFLWWLLLLTFGDDSFELEICGSYLSSHFRAQFWLMVQIARFGDFKLSNY